MMRPNLPAACLTASLCGAGTGPLGIAERMGAARPGLNAFALDPNTLDKASSDPAGREVPYALRVRCAGSDS